MSRLRSYSVARRQRGISLLVVLLLLVVMSVLGVAVLRSSAMQERMSANLRDRSLATQAVEAALQAGRAALAADPQWRTTELSPGDACINGVCPPFTTEAAAVWRDVPAWQGVATEYAIEYLGQNQAALETGGVISGSEPELTNMGPMFRITARTEPGSGRALVVLQSDVIYRHPKL